MESGTLVGGRYRVRREIARGAVGRVFEAQQVFTGRAVALKVLQPGYAAVAEERLLREARALGVLRHPGIVDIADAGRDAAGPYLALEMLEGRTLEGLLAARRKLPIPETVHLARHLAEALAFAHGAGVVHRDLKPSNVFVARVRSGAEIPKLIDFGIASFDHASEGEASSRKLTRSGELLGTPEYMAPEQLMTEPRIDHRADLYAFGVLLFECLTGEVPFSGSYPEVLLRVTTSKGPPPLLAARPEAGEHLAAIVGRCLARDPASRPPDAAWLARALASLPAATQGRSPLLQVGLPKPSPAEGSHFRGADEFASRRRFPRAPYVTPVRILREGGGVLDGRSEDVSEGGMLIVAPVPGADREDVRVRFAAPMSGRVVQARATARWVRAARDGRGAIGVEFVDLEAGARAEVASYVQSMARAS